ncbi:hypothetical protein LJR231_001568 [Phyllobacterium sp. LjRoot231]|uniref:phage fiber-tail adaptor protein n=1 Tax=Phyllobacterium sp. LjRoot231 TaxID=3342289 RepID=UPI003ED12580
MSSVQLEKSPDDVLDYDIHYDRWLPASDVIASVVTSIASTTALIDRNEFTTSSVKVWVSGGATGENGTVTVVITTQEGRTKEACFRLRIKDCS